jgi:AAA family ATP:ADP antiporter
LGRLAAGLGALVTVTIPLAVGWAALGIWLGRRQARQAEYAFEPKTASVPSV